MANIKTFDASEAETTLRPSETASAAYIRAGTVAREYTDQAARLMRETGEAWGKAFREVGQGVESIADHAQATTDAQAMLEANKDSSALDLKSITDIQEMGKPKLDPKSGDMETATTAEATQAAATMHDNYAQAQQAIRDKMVAAGASQKALTTFDERAQERQAQHAAHLNAEVHSIAGIEATTNFTKSTDVAAALASASPGDLDLILSGWRKDTNAIFATGVFSKEAAEAMGEKAVVAQRQRVTSGIEAMARSGPEGVNQALQAIHDPKYSPYIGVNINALTNTVTRFAREEAVEKREQAAEADKRDKDAANARVGAYNQDRQPGDPLYNFKDDPYARKNPEWARTTKKQIDPELSDKTRDQFFNSLVVSGQASKDPEKAQHDVDVAYGQRQLSKADHQELTQQITHAQSPEGKRIYAEMKDFLGPEGYGPKIRGELPGGLLKDPGASGIAMHDARTYVQQRIQEIQEGRDSATKNPMDLFREGSKVFLGDDKAFTSKYVTPGQKLQDLKDMGNALRNKTPSATNMKAPPKGLQGPALSDWFKNNVKPGEWAMTPNGPRQKPMPAPGVAGLAGQ